MQTNVKLWIAPQNPNEIRYFGLKKHFMPENTIYDFAKFDFWGRVKKFVQIASIRLSIRIKNFSNYAR